MGTVTAVSITGSQSPAHLTVTHIVFGIIPAVCMVYKGVVYPLFPVIGIGIGQVPGINS